jgi:hypothetical protein
LKKIIKIFSACAFFKAPCTPYRGGIKNNKKLHSEVFILAPLFHIKFHKKNTWAHESPHISKKTQKTSGHMKAHSIILEFAPSGMCETNIYREKLIRT